MSNNWQLILLGPADLERSIIDSALRQAGFKLSVLNHFEDLEKTIEDSEAHGILVTGTVVGRESETFDLLNDVCRPAARGGHAVLVLRDASDTSPLPADVVTLARPLRFPAGAATIDAALIAHQQAALDGASDLAAATLRGDLRRAATSKFNGVLVVDAVETPGQVHFQNGVLTLVVCGGLTGPEALGVLLGARQGLYRFDPQQEPQGDDNKTIESVVSEADALELRTAEMLTRAPQGPLEPDPVRLLSRLNRLSDNIAWIFRLIDGKRDIQALSRMGGMRAVESTLSLIEDGILVAQKGSSRVLGVATPEAPQEREEPAVPEKTALEDDFAWSLAVGGVSGMSPTSLKEEGWSQDGPSEWDQLPDLDLGIERALTDAQTFFKTQLPGPTGAVEGGIEPLLNNDDEPPIDESDDFDPPPIMSDDDIFADEGQLPPIGDDDDLPPPIEEDLPPPMTDSAPPRQALSDSDTGFRASASGASDVPYQAMGTGSFGHDDEMTVDPTELEIDDDFIAARQRLIKKFRFAVIAVVLFGLAAFSTYRYSQRIKKTTRGEVERAIAWDPSMKEPQTEAQKAESEASKAVMDAGPSRPSARKSKKRKRSRRRVRKARRRRLPQGEFSKRMQGARMLRDDGNLEGAVELIGMALRLRVSKAERSVALSERGEAHFSAGYTAKAIEDLRQAVTLDQTNRFALKTLGLIEYQNFKSGDASARDRARGLLLKYNKISGRRDAAVARWLAELE